MMDSLKTDFSRMVKECRSTIYTVCYMFSKDGGEVEDLFQDILINLWKGWAGFRGESGISTWVWRVSLNTCISAQRKRRKMNFVPLDMDINLFSDDDEDTRQIRMLKKRISALGPFDRAIVLLWLENLSYDEIGQIVGITAKNVSVRLFRIKEQLKKIPG